MSTVLKWVGILAVVPLLTGWFYVDPLYRAARCLAQLQPVERVAMVMEPGHGAYCSNESEPSVFLGRDVPELGSYQAFDRWCQERGGETSWKV